MKRNARKKENGSVIYEIRIAAVTAGIVEATVGIAAVTVGIAEEEIVLIEETEGIGIEIGREIGNGSARRHVGRENGRRKKNEREKGTGKDIFGCLHRFWLFSIVLYGMKLYSN